MTSNNTRKRGLVIGGIAALLVAGVATGGALVTPLSTISSNIFGTTDQSTDPKSKLKADGDPIVYDFDGGLQDEAVIGYYSLENIIEKDGGDDLAVTAKIQRHAGDKDYMDALLKQLKVEISTDDGKTWKPGGANLDAMAANFGTLKADETRNIGIKVFNDTANGFPSITDRAKKATIDFQFDAAVVAP